MPASPLDTLYRARLSTANAGLLLRVRALFAQQFSFADPSTSLSLIGAITAAWVTSAQAAFATEGTRYLQALLAQAAQTRLEEVAPLQVPDALIGGMDSGQPLSSLAASTPATYWSRIGGGDPPQTAAGGALSWLNAVAGSEPFRAANTTVVDNANGDDRFTGRVTRITRAGCCDVCQLIHDRGYIPAHAGFEAHRNCRCSPAPEISSHVYSRRGMARAIDAELYGRPSPPAFRGRGAGGAGGAGGGGGGGVTGGGGRDRALLTPQTTPFRRTDLPAPGQLPGDTRTPPTHDELLQRGQIRPDGSAFSASERRLAERLGGLGIDVVSVDSLDGAYGRTPDAAMRGQAATVELKQPTARSGSDGVSRALREGRDQSRRLVIELMPGVGIGDAWPNPSSW